MIESVPVIVFILIIHQIHYLYRSPLPFRTLAYALGIVQIRESNRPHRRSGFARNTSTFDAKRRIHLASRRGSYMSSGASGIVSGGCEGRGQCGSDKESDERSVESVGLTDILQFVKLTEMTGLLCDDRAEGEIVEGENSDDVDFSESVAVEEMQSDPVGVSLSDFTNLMEELQNLSMEASSSETGCVYPYEPVELTEEPVSTHAGRPSDNAIEMAQIPRSPSEEPTSSHAEKTPDNPIVMDQVPVKSKSEEPPGRNFVPGKRNFSQDELVEENVPLNLKIPAHARAKSNRRSLESIEPILDRKAKLPLGPADAP